MLLSIIILVIAAFMAGYYWRDIWDRVRFLQRATLNKLQPAPRPDEPIGQVVDPDEYDPIAVAKAEFEARTRKLNDK